MHVKCNNLKYRMTIKLNEEPNTMKVQASVLCLVDYETKQR
ncbi:hypothetical protein HanXRQr2_Chr16g0734351 [Helianthus annuus]|uniref:Uncharacterized protein n=1 Tax=Helianthus annuus TaxID=4232 RepID=A0A9K3DNY5_HELAN|nr:hypothetical protein HanXRQr2_Chr16g0734351 [Helianthus annuus]KAJ0441529.1 hypothetical protein HanIR_Chr16g0798771 [Helianthus annuus]KAJ0820153.1 hypothetical protein HanPSC8_Chr16g0704481 [Helianthus annuus]